MSPRPAFQPTQEIRLAVVMYGGVSLAIYINGVAQELLRLVRATAPRTPPSPDEYPSEALLAEDELHGSERVYRRLGQLLEWSPAAGARPVGVRRADAPDAADPVRTRVVVDILSGSSAGGINGIFLAKALAGCEPIDQLRELWIGEGDIATLVNDDASLAGTLLAAQRPPRSVLNSRRMYWQLLSALDGMDAAVDGASASPLVDELDLWITATDVHGLVLPIDLADRVVFERRYRAVFHFAAATPYASGGDEPRNDFTRAANPLLAFAARATASFPFAFEPMTLEDVDEVVAARTFAEAYGELGSTSPRWRAWFRDYARADDGDPTWYRRVAFGDGGYLDNKPFTWATSTLQRRRADRPVDRKLLYVEPDPGALHALVKDGASTLPRVRPPADQYPPEKPDALANTRAALLTLPRAETIREDLDRLLERNRGVARLAQLTAIVDEVASEAWRSLPTAEWLPLTAEELARSRGAPYLAYYRLKLAALLDDLADVATVLAGFDAGSDERKAVRAFVEAWARRAVQPGEEQNRLLLDLDLGYRLRRIAFLQDRLDQLLRLDERAAVVLGEVPAERRDELAASLQALKAALNGVLVRLRAAGRELRRRGSGNPVWERLPELPLTREELLRVLSGAGSEEAAVDGAALFLVGRPALEAAIGELVDVLRERLRGVFTSIDTRAELVAAAPAQDTAGGAAGRALDALLRLYDRFEEYDAIILPVGWGWLGEADRVDVIRVSPEDATSIRDEVATGLRKLGGVELNHFGGFFSRDWRVNDLLWGRLDAAERIVTSLLPTDRYTEELRGELLRQAQLAIVAEELARAGSSEEPERALARLASTEVSRTLEPSALLPVVRRSLRVTGALLGGREAAYLLTSPVRWLLVAGEAMAAVAGAAVTRLCVAAAGLLLAASVALVVVGATLDVPAAARAGWSTLVPLAIALAALLLVGMLVRRLGRPRAARSSGGAAPRSPTWRQRVLAAATVAGVLIVLAAVALPPLGLLQRAGVERLVSWLPGWRG